MRKAIVIAILCIISGIAVYYYLERRIIERAGIEKLPEIRIAKGVKIDKLVAYKAKHKLCAYSNGKLIKTYIIAIGTTPVGKKQFEGDRKTPEGNYTIYDKNPNSKFHKNLGISYPNAADLAIAKKLGKPPGGDIKIHGCNDGHAFLGKLQRWVDWTHGCIALTNDEIDELYEHVAIGTPVTIEP